MNIDVNFYGNLTDFDFGATVDFEREPDLIANVDISRDYCDICYIYYADGTPMSDNESAYWLAELDEAIRDKAGDKYDDIRFS